MRHVTIMKYCETFKCRGKTIFYWLTADLKPVFLSLAKKIQIDAIQRSKNNNNPHVPCTVSDNTYIYIYKHIHVYLPTVATKKTTEHLGLVSTLNIRSSKNCWGMQGFIPPSIISHHIIVLVRIGHLRKNSRDPTAAGPPCVFGRFASYCSRSGKANTGGQPRVERTPLKFRTTSYTEKPVKMLSQPQLSYQHVSTQALRVCIYAYVHVYIYIYISFIQFSRYTYTVHKHILYYKIWNTIYNNIYNIKIYIILYYL